MSHTKEPWILRQGNEIGVADKSDTQSYGMLNVIARVDKYDFENWQENAHRIVACVNACEGIHTKTLEHANKLRAGSNGINTAYSIAAGERDTYRDLCGELKKRLIASRFMFESYGINLQQLGDQINESIAKAEAILGEKK